MATEAGLGYTIKPPRSYTPGRKSGQPTVIVIHTTEGSERGTSAEDGAAYDARRTDGTSTHFFVDQDSIVQCVRTTDEAHAARAHGNDVGIQIEICGVAGQSAAQWADAASSATLENVAQLCVKLRAKYNGRFPVKRLTPGALRAGGRGFVGHVDVTRAWPEDGGTHTDPGPNFPWSKLFDRIIEIESGDDMSAADAELGIMQAFAKAANATDTDPNNDDTNGRNFRINLDKVLDFTTKQGPLMDAVAGMTALLVKQSPATAREIAVELGPILGPQIIAGLGESGSALTLDAVQNAVEIGVANVLQRGVGGTSLA